MAGHPRSLEVLGSTSRTHRGDGAAGPCPASPSKEQHPCSPLSPPCGSGEAAEPTGKLGREELTPNPTTGRGEKNKTERDQWISSKSRGREKGETERERACEELQEERDECGSEEEKRAELAAGGECWGTGQG